MGLLGLRFVLFVIVSAFVVEGKKAKHQPWGITVYTKIDTVNVRAVSAQTSSFIWEGTITYGWWDDSLINQWNLQCTGATGACDALTLAGYDGTQMAAYPALLNSYVSSQFTVTMNSVLGQYYSNAAAPSPVLPDGIVKTFAAPGGGFAYELATGAAGSNTAIKNYYTNIIDDAAYTWSIGQLSQYYVGQSYDAGSASVYPIVTPQIVNQLAVAGNAINWALNFDVPDHVGEDCPGYAADPATPSNWECPDLYYYADKCRNNGGTLTCNYNDAAQGVKRLWVVGTQRLSVTVQAPQDLHNFPLDTQTITFSLINSNVAAGDMQFKLTPGTTESASPTNSIDGYTLVSTTASVTTSERPNQNSQINVKFVIKRIPDVYFNRFILPLVLVSALILCLQFANTAARTMAAFTIMGTTTSFVFISSNSVPLLPYRTRLDNYFAFQFVLAFVVGVWNIYSTHWADRFKDKYLKHFQKTKGGEEKAKEEKKDKKEDKKEEKEEVVFVPPLGWAGWAATVAGLPNPYRNPAVSPPKAPAPKKADVVPVSIIPADGQDKTSKEREKEKDIEGGTAKTDKKTDEPKTTETLLSQLLEFHVKGKADEKKKSDKKKEDELKMAELHLAYDVRFACLLVGGYILCVACIFLA